MPSPSECSSLRFGTTPITKSREPWIADGVIGEARFEARHEGDEPLPVTPPLGGLTVLSTRSVTGARLILPACYRVNRCRATVYLRQVPTYRDDHEAALARADALERELEDTRPGGRGQGRRG